MRWHVLFTGPIWFSFLLPILFALILLTASLAVRSWGGSGVEKAPWLAIGGFALAFGIGGAPFGLMLAAVVLLTHWCALAMERAADGPRGEGTRSSSAARPWLIAAVGVHAVLVVAIWRGGLITGRPDDFSRLLLPFGATYFAFHGISYVVDVYRRRVAAQHSLWQLSTHLVLMPQIVGGPVTYEVAAPQIGRQPDVSDFSYGTRRLFLGIWKVFVMARLAARPADAAFALGPEELTTFQAWLGLACFTIQIYYAFSGYADMGVGLGRMLGFRLPENFRWPYAGETVQDFWQRWHMGLTAWFRQYATGTPAPEGAPGLTLAREVFVVVLCGIWYGVGWTFVVWGLYHALLIVVERAGAARALPRLPRVVRHLYVVTAIMAGWVILRSDTLAGALLFARALAGQHVATESVRVAVPMTPELWLVLVGGAIGCAPLVSTVRRWTVAIDALTTSLLMMLFASLLFAWRCGEIVAAPLVAVWRRPWVHGGRRGSPGRDDADVAARSAACRR